MTEWSKDPDERKKKLRAIFDEDVAERQTALQWDLFDAMWMGIGITEHMKAQLRLLTDPEKREQAIAEVASSIGALMWGASVLSVASAALAGERA